MRVFCLEGCKEKCLDTSWIRGKSCIMTHESLTENIVRNLLREKGYYNDDNIFIEEKKSQNPKIDKLLKNASKSGNGPGYPEFIISFKNKPDDLIVIECKRNTLFHESKNKECYKDYAVDGALLYSSYLQKEYNIPLAIE